MSTDPDVTRVPGESRPVTLAPGQVVERYTVEALLGEGGVATVYRVRHNTLGSRHALKVIHLSAPSMRERLVQEGRVQASLQHPNIVTVTDVVDHEGSPGLIMELVDGPSLAEWLPDHPPPLEEAERLFRGILAGVARAHKLGLVHRDLKPGNVLLAAADDGTLVPKVTDFGLAKILFDDESALPSTTRSGTTMGTPAYMAPEQVKDAKSVDQRADIFALGCILYELVTARSPFDRADVLQVFAALALGRYRPPEELAPDLPVRIRTAIQGCLSVDRDARIQDCRVLRQVLDGHTDSWTGSVSFTGEVATPPPALRAPIPERPRPDAPTPAGRRSRAPMGLAVAGVGVAGLGAAAVLALGLLAGLGWLWLRAPAEPRAPEGSGVVAAPPEVEPVPAPVAAPPPPDPSPPAPATSPSPRTPGRKATPEPAAEAPAPAAGTVRASGDADRVWLEAAGARFELGEVPAGEYSVKADFGAQGAVSAGRVRVRAGDTVDLACSAAFQMCQAR